MAGAKEKIQATRAPPVANYRKKIGEKVGKDFKKITRQSTGGKKVRGSSSMDRLEVAGFGVGGLLAVALAACVLIGAYVYLLRGSA